MDFCCSFFLCARGFCVPEMHALRCGARRRLSSWSGVGGASTAPLPSVSALSAALRGGRRLAFVTAYSAWEASLACGSDVDALVGALTAAQQLFATVD
jgi:hypothetical protein